jgi:hypothetical protein
LIDIEHFLRDMRSLRESISSGKVDFNKTQLNRTEIFNIVSRIALCMAELAELKRVLETMSVDSKSSVVL